MSDSEAWTIGRLLTWTTEFLKKHHAESPRLDAEVLLAHARGCQRIQLYTAFDQLADEALRTSFRALVKQRADGLPVAYLVGKREFYSLNFRVTPDVLIPRPETEFLVVRLLDLAKKLSAEGAAGAQPAPRILDVGTGSGIIAICAAKKIPQAKVTAIDISPAALTVARQNAADLGVAERVEFIESDLLAALPPDRTFEIIASNPPYISAAEFELLEPSVRDREPRLALLGGTQGTEIICRLIDQAAERLVPGGYLLCEISPTLPGLVELFAAGGKFEVAPPIKDLAGQIRVMQARRLG